MKRLSGNLYKSGETVEHYNDSDFDQLTPGAYVCRITFAKDEPSENYLYVEYDIAEGEHKDYYKNLSASFNFWGGNVRLYYTDKSTNIFKRAIKAINISNKGYVFNPFGDGSNADEKTLVGKLIGIVMHEEEYIKKDTGELKTNIKGQATGFINTDKARKGEFNKKLLEKKTLESKPAGSTPATAKKPAGDWMNVTGDSSENPFL